MSQIPSLTISSTTFSEIPPIKEKIEIPMEGESEIVFNNDDIKKLLNRVVVLERENADLKNQFKKFEMKQILNQLWNPSEVLRREARKQLEGQGIEALPLLIQAIKFNCKVDKNRWKSEEEPQWISPTPLWDYAVDSKDSGITMLEAAIWVLLKMKKNPDNILKIKESIKTLLEDMETRGLKLHHCRGAFDITALVYFLGKDLGICELPKRFISKLITYFQIIQLSEVAESLINYNWNLEINFDDIHKEVSSSDEES